MSFQLENAVQIEVLGTRRVVPCVRAEPQRRGASSDEVSIFLTFAASQGCQSESGVGSRSCLLLLIATKTNFIAEGYEARCMP